jgi:hypothetical protein
MNSCGIQHRKNGRWQQVGHHALNLEMNHAKYIKRYFSLRIWVRSGHTWRTTFTILSGANLNLPNRKVFIFQTSVFSWQEILMPKDIRFHRKSLFGPLKSICTCQMTFLKQVSLFLNQATLSWRLLSTCSQLSLTQMKKGYKFLALTTSLDLCQ